jgi:hypothetical protein
MKCIVNGKIILKDGLLEGKAVLFDRKIRGFADVPARREDSPSGRREASPLGRGDASPLGRCEAGPLGAAISNSSFLIPH